MCDEKIKHCLKKVQCVLDKWINLGKSKDSCCEQSNGSMSSNIKKDSYKLKRPPILSLYDVQNQSDNKFIKSKCTNDKSYELRQEIETRANKSNIIEVGYNGYEDGDGYNYNMPSDNDLLEKVIKVLFEYISLVQVRG